MVSPTVLRDPELPSESPHLSPSPPEDGSGRGASGLTAEAKESNFKAAHFHLSLGVLVLSQAKA